MECTRRREDEKLQELLVKCFWHLLSGGFLSRLWGSVLPVLLYCSHSLPSVQGAFGVKAVEPQNFTAGHSGIQPETHVLSHFTEQGTGTGGSTESQAHVHDDVATARVSLSLSLS